MEDLFENAVINALKGKTVKDLFVRKDDDNKNRWVMEFTDGSQFGFYPETKANLVLIVMDEGK